MKVFVEYDHLFRTPLFRGKYEEQARRNIRNEIDTLTRLASS